MAQIRTFHRKNFMNPRIELPIICCSCGHEIVENEQYEQINTSKHYFCKNCFSKDLLVYQPKNGLGKHRHFGTKTQSLYISRHKM